ncbi:hypothetical protein BD779DRAFT_1680836 [Infundibulicybe gibba]|nr:hypothetical protein BD779DRAFT_1680836 [Infundibulicybe gibba]
MPTTITHTPSSPKSKRHLQQLLRRYPQVIHLALNNINRNLVRDTVPELAVGDDQELIDSVNPIPGCSDGVLSREQMEDPNALDVLASPFTSPSGDIHPLPPGSWPAPHRRWVMDLDSNVAFHSLISPSGRAHIGEYRSHPPRRRRVRRRQPERVDII